MSKKDKTFICSECGAIYPRWIGKCEDCKQWNTITDVISVKMASQNEKVIFTSLDDQSAESIKIKSNIEEFDCVCGNGIAKGSVILIGGDPGIGKSTLLLQILASLSKQYKCLYISGEESKEQICLRAARLGLANSNIQLACDTNINAIISSLSLNEDFIVVDSIQTLYNSLAESIPGSVTQVKICTADLINLAKKHNITIFLVGHVTKDGAIAGPKVLEHMVDTVLYFEGEMGNSYRVLRAVKNRYGPSGEVGIFEMKDTGLYSVENPSEMFINFRNGNLPGNTIFVTMEGSRPMMLEVQALVTKSYFSVPRRTVVGCDLNRLLAILAVLESRCKISFSDRDVYLNIAAGMKITEPAGDLAIAISLLSARLDKVLPEKTCIFGELGLTGEIRPVSHSSERIKEALKLNFSQIICPEPLHEKGTLSFSTMQRCLQTVFQ